jgi:hypothetical protein
MELTEDQPIQARILNNATIVKLVSIAHSIGMTKTYSI